MAASSSLPLAVLLFLLVLVASAVPATSGGKYSGARMVIIRGPATTRVGGAAGAQSNKWRQHYRRLEDEVAPELGGLLLGADDGRIGYGALDPNNPGCESSSQCAAKGRGGSYTRGCTYKEQCNH